MWDSIFPGTNLDPSVLFELEGREGPHYRGIFSGTVMNKSSHAAYLFLRLCDALPPNEWIPPAGARKTAPVSVTVAHFRPGPHQHSKLTRDDAIRSSILIALFPILGSAVAAIMCALFQDWVCFSMIILGMVTSGTSCWIIGTGELNFFRPDPITDSPRACGVLADKDNIIILKGSKYADRAMTRGKFFVEYKGSKSYNRLGFSALLLTIQFLAQLLIVPQGTNFGQIMFLTSLGVSWMYNSYLSSIDRESLQGAILLEKVLGQPDLCKYTFGTKTGAVTFKMLVIASDEMATMHRQASVASPHPESRPSSRTSTTSASALLHEELDPDFDERVSNDMAIDDEGPLSPDARELRAAMEDMIPHATPMWLFWKETLFAQLQDLIRGEDFKRRQAPPSLERGERILLGKLYKDVETAVVAFRAYQR